ncbi:ABC transporter permease [Terrihabitans sp. B22-R8]|uniref:ABC transporter permease n=1 Tax=Terrihabitans sp. B22-R8 TaxID=3425128 RepID=UPI00403C3FEF
MKDRVQIIGGAAFRILVTVSVLLGLWWLAVRVFAPAPFILPGPERVFSALVRQHDYLVANALVTMKEIVIGLLAGTVLGIATALLMASSSTVRRWLLPMLVLSQVLPVFAIAPLLVVWFGYGLASKIVMTTIIIFFPITSAFQDGLRRTDPGLLDLARLAGAPRWRTLWLIKVPHALPALVSGLRVAIAAAPIGAVVGEWVGASAGLGYVMLNANARAQTDVLFAALLILGLVAALLWFTLDAALARLVPWSDERRLA